MEIYRRELYLKKIRGFYNDTGLIKVITGVRRCGKSCLMQSVREELEQSGVAKDHIIDINLDRKGNLYIKKPALLEKKIDKLVPEDDKIVYLFIDEIQNVTDFEPLINAYREEGRYSIFITGSNSYLLSGELITKLTGRYIEFEMYPLDFNEYLEMKAFLGKEVTSDKTVLFNEYIRNGGFPKSLSYDSDDDRKAYIKSVVSEIIEKDIKSRVKVRNISVFERVFNYLINNFAATTSVKGITEYFNRQEHNPIKVETIRRYIKIMEDAKLIYKCSRFDLRSKKSLRGEEKYYLSDLSFYRALNTDNRINYGPVLENLVYINRRINGYDISIGRIGKLECDFICRKSMEDYSYIQVAMTILADRATEDREYRPFEMIKDNYPKYLLTMDSLIQQRNGVIHKNIIDFLIG